MMTEAKMTGGRKTVLKKMVIRTLVFFVVVTSLCILSSVSIASAQEQPSAQKADSKSGDQAAQPKPQQGTEASSPERQPASIGGELAKETRVAEGEEEEEHSDLKHSSVVQKLAKLTGMSVHGAHLFALILNFSIIAILLIWAIGKTVPGIMKARNASIQKALEEARKASQEAGKRLADIENRLRQMDVEIGRMQASSEKDAEAEEARIKKAAEDDLRKVVQSAEQEIAAAAKQIRRELSVHTADLALALARKQINVDTNTDQVLVRNFAARLAEPAKPESKGDGGRNGGKDGR